MKIRNGFVSNSSSSSFVVLLPENFVETIDFNKIVNEDDDFPLEDFKKVVDRLLIEEGLWLEEIYNMQPRDSDYDFREILDDLLDPYVIASMEGGPDEGQIVVANREKIKKLL